MRNIALLILIFSLSIFTFGQDQKSNFKKESNTLTTEKKDSDDEKESFINAISEKNAAKRITALKNFVEQYPESEQKQRALGLIVSGRAEVADKQLQEGKNKEATELFKLAVKEAPSPVSDRLFRSIILQIPNNLFFRGERVAGVEVAELIEAKVADNPNQLLALTTFYLGIENAPAAIRVAEKVREINPETKGLYQALGLSYRFNFNLEKSAEAYALALASDTSSIAAKISLAEMKRAIGKSDEAVKLYSEVLEVEPKNLSARTGLSLSLFDADKAVEAEKLMDQILLDEPNSMFLLVGAAYWYASKGNGEKAIELSQKALTIEPRYTWGYIALARGLLLTGKPVEAESALFTARKFGNFPTLEYEIASTRLAAGFYKDAADELQKSFTLKDGVLKTKLGGRLEVEAENFTKLLSLERQASIFQPNSADLSGNAEKLKTLLKFTQNLNAENVDETKLIESADEFISGQDRMKTHRQMFVASQLLDNQKALSKIVEITKEAVKDVDNALNVPNPSAAVLAEELYETRAIAFRKGEVLIVPEVPHQTLSSILRGRIEEIAGWALHQQKEDEEARIRLKRAVSILPKDSVWIRSSYWRMGMILEAEGKQEEALDNYIKGYTVEEPSEVKKITIETLYQKINGSLDGLEERMNAKSDDENPASIFIKKDETAKKQPTELKEKDSSENKEVIVKKDDSGVTTENKSLENTLDSQETNKQNPLTGNENSLKPNVDKLPEDINLDIFNPTKTKPTPQPKETDNNDLENKNVEKIKTDEIKTDTDSKSNEGEAIENKPKNETVEKSEIPKIVGKPLVIINDNLSNTSTQLEINEGEVKKEIDNLESENKKQPVSSEKTEKTDLETPKENEIISNSDEKSTSDKINSDKRLTKKEVDSSSKDQNAQDDNNKEEDKTAQNEIPKEENKDIKISRPRIVANEDGETNQIEPPICEILVTQEEFTVFNNGESHDVVIVVEKSIKDGKFIATSSSPEDVEVLLQPKVMEENRSAFFIVRSISSNKGEFKITFETPCGKKEIKVKVR